MKWNLFWVGVIWLFFSCGKAESNINSLDGTYIGYFHRNQEDTQQVSLLFNENQYSGFRDRKYCPTLGRGTFEQDENSIIFKCPSQKGNIPQPELNGAYSYEVNADGSIRIWRIEGNISDEYILRKSYDESLVYGY